MAPEAVIESLDVDHLYQIPLNLQAQGMDQIVCDHLKIDAPAADMTEWSAMVDKVMSLKKQVKIALVGKYVELQDAYISVVEALKHSGYANDAEVKIDWVNANDVTADNVAELLSDADGIIVPGGFGQRGTEGKIEAIRYARENDVPMLGVCLGMQLTCIEFARHVLGLEGANSAELDPDTKYPIIDIMRDQIDVEDMGGTLRLGLYPSKLKRASKAAAAIITKKWSNVATATVMSLTMPFVNSLKEQVLSSQVFHQTIAWSKLLKSQKTNSLLLVSTIQNFQVVQIVQKNSTLLL